MECHVGWVMDSREHRSRTASVRWDSPLWTLPLDSTKTDLSCWILQDSIVDFLWILISDEKGFTHSNRQEMIWEKCQFTLLKKNNSLCGLLMSLISCESNIFDYWSISNLLLVHVVSKFIQSPNGTINFLLFGAGHFVYICGCSHSLFSTSTLLPLSSNASPSEGTPVLGNIGCTPQSLPKFQHPSHELLKENGFTQHVYHKYRRRCLNGTNMSTSSSVDQLF